MEVMVPLPDRDGSDFSFHSGNNSPYDSAPQSPKNFDSYFFSAPTTPNYQHLNYDYHRGSDDKLFGFVPGHDSNLLPLSSAKKTQDSSSSSSSRSSFGWLQKKWRLKDLLFRSASEASETNKYDFLRKDKNGDLKNSSSSPSNSVFSGNKKNKEKATLSAHERHYKVNRAAAEEMRKRTYLPYKQNLMVGCMYVDAASVSDPSRATLKIR
ncbi:hypothetical protein ACET3Z_022019 [Daucus carota]